MAPAPRRATWTALENLMREAGYNTTTLGRAAGLAQPTVWSIVYGTRRGHPASIAAIAAVFGMTSNQLEALREPYVAPEAA